MRRLISISNYVCGLVVIVGMVVFTVGTVRTLWLMVEYVDPEIILVWYKVSLAGAGITCISYALLLVFNYLEDIMDSRIF